MAAIVVTPTPVAAGCAGTHDLAGIDLPRNCLTAEQARIVRMRVFRSDLAVAALSCGKQDQYNRLVSHHRMELVREGQALKSLFGKWHKGASDGALNRFVTHLANRASMRRLNAEGYCTRMARVFDRALALPPNGLNGFVKGRPVMAALDAPSGKAVRHTPMPAEKSIVTAQNITAPTVLDD